MLGGVETMTITQNLFPFKLSQAPYMNNIGDGTPALSMYKKFVMVSSHLNRAFIQHLCLNHTSKTPATCKAETSKPITINIMPYPRYKNPKVGIFSVQDFVALVIPLSYVLLVPLIVKRITDEKSTKAKELLRLIGMADFVFWLAHFLNYFIIVLFHSIIVTILFFVLKVSVFTLSSPFIFWIGFLLFGAQMILFSMLITTIFNRFVPFFI